MAPPQGCPRCQGSAAPNVSRKPQDPEAGAGQPPRAARVSRTEWPALRCLWQDGCSLCVNDRELHVLVKGECCGEHGPVKTRAGFKQLHGLLFTPSTLNMRKRTNRKLPGMCGWQWAGEAAALPSRPNSFARGSGAAWSSRVRSQRGASRQPQRGQQVSSSSRGAAGSGCTGLSSPGRWSSVCSGQGRPPKIPTRSAGAYGQEPTARAQQRRPTRKRHAHAHMVSMRERE